jgi:hypothetical protein
MAWVYAALEQQVLDIPQSQRKAHVDERTSRITTGGELKPLNALGGFARDLRSIQPIWQPEIAPATRV